MVEIYQATMYPKRIKVQFKLTRRCIQREGTRKYTIDFRQD